MAHATTCLLATGYDNGLLPTLPTGRFSNGVDLMSFYLIVKRSVCDLQVFVSVQTKKCLTYGNPNSNKQSNHIYKRKFMANSCQYVIS